MNEANQTVLPDGRAETGGNSLPEHRAGRAVVTKPALPSLWMSIVVERACTGIWKVWEEDGEVVELRVNPAVYQAVARARPGEVSRGYPLMLLGLELIPDETVRIYEPVVVRT